MHVSLTRCVCVFSNWIIERFFLLSIEHINFKSISSPINVLLNLTSRSFNSVPGEYTAPHYRYVHQKETNHSARK